MKSRLRHLVDTRIQPWITNCCNDHATCRKIDSTEDHSLLPTRLIDVSDANRLYLRSSATDIAPDQLTAKYLILSYCWGKANFGMSTTENVEDRQNMGFLETEVSQTVRDAIHLTREMGYKYIWVDAICIIQPSKADGFDLTDWSKEAVRMGSYYRNAKCMIAASKATDSSEGFLDAPPSLPYPVESCTIGTRTCIHDSGSPEMEDYLVLYPGPVSWVREFQRQPLMSRGWCLQEWLLARRVLHFSRNGLFWECRDLKGASETDPLHNDDRNHSQTEADAGIHLIREILDPSTPDEHELLPQRWARCLTVYAKMNLTHGKDRLIAIQGVGQRISEKLDDEYAAGIFRSSLAGLMWRGPGMETTMATHVPSWSWASIPRPTSLRVEFLSQQSIMYGYRHQLFDPVSKEAFPKSEGVDFESLESRKLRVRAPLRTVDLGNGELEMPHHGALTPGRDGWGQTRFILEFDALDLVPKPVGKVTMLLMGYSRVEEQPYPDFWKPLRFRVIGLLVRPAICPEDAHLRVGFFEIQVYEDGFDDVLDDRWKTDVILV